MSFMIRNYKPKKIEIIEQSLYTVRRFLDDQNGIHPSIIVEFKFEFKTYPIANSSNKWI